MRSDVPLLERDHELAVVDGLVDAARAGAGAVLVIEGPAGSGKTRPLAAACRLAAERQVMVLRARSGELEQGTPYGLVRELFAGPLAQRRAGRVAVGHGWLDACCCPTARCRPRPGSSRMPEPTRHLWAEVGGHRLFYREAGPSGAPAVVLLHGYPASSFMFRDLIPALADAYHVVAPDCLGAGFSDAPSATGSATPSTSSPTSSRTCSPGGACRAGSSTPTSAERRPGCRSRT